jgi:hypothetical protein
MFIFALVESQEGLKRNRMCIAEPLRQGGAELESQEGLKQSACRDRHAACAVHYLAVHHVESQEGLKRLCEHVWLEIVS